MSSFNEALAPPATIPGNYLSSTLPAASSVAVGTAVSTTDRGTLYSNGLGWQTTQPDVFNPIQPIVTKLRAAIAQALTTNPATAQPLIQPSAYPGSTTAVTKGTSFSN